MWYQKRGKLRTGIILKVSLFFCFGLDGVLDEGSRWRLAGGVFCDFGKSFETDFLATEDEMVW